MSTIDRRAFLTGSAIVATGAALAGLTGCGTSSQTDDSAPAESTTTIQLPIDLTLADVEGSLVELDPITEFAAEESYDVVVVGAGVAGVPAVLTAVEEALPSAACSARASPPPTDSAPPPCIRQGPPPAASSAGWRISPRVTAGESTVTCSSIMWTTRKRPSPGWWRNAPSLVWRA